MENKSETRSLHRRLLKNGSLLPLDSRPVSFEGNTVPSEATLGRRAYEKMIEGIRTKVAIKTATEREALLIAHIDENC